MKRFSLPLSIAMLLACGHAFADGNAETGKTKAAACAACHGPDGNAGIDAQYPRLAGQYQDYIARALHEYKSGDRKNPIMGGFAKTLSDTDIADLAAYFSSLPGSKLTDLHGHVQGD